MRAWVKLTLLVYAAVLIGIALTFAIFGIPPKPESEFNWSEDAAGYRDNNLLWVMAESGMPAAYVPDAVALVTCSAEKLSNKTDGTVDMLDLRAVEVTYMIDKGYFPGTYADACAAVSGWESACKAPYAIDCSEVLDFIETNHDDIAAAIDECSD